MDNKMKQQDAAAGQLVLLKVVAKKTIDEVEMGVLADGTAFVSGRGLAKLCGVAPSAVIFQADNWKEGKRDGRLAKKLIDAGYTSDSLFIRTPSPFGGGILHAYVADVASIVLGYYAFQLKNDTALENFEMLASHGMREGIYARVGYTPNKPKDPLQHFYDRLMLNPPPTGYFTVFHEAAKWELLSAQAGLAMDPHTIMDISIGTLWAAEWKREEYEDIHGKARKHLHLYPSGFPQSLANGQIEVSAYPNAALGDFRTWMEEVYMPQKFPTYLNSKLRAGVVTATAVKKILAAVAPRALTP